MKLHFKNMVRNSMLGFLMVVFLISLPGCSQIQSLFPSTQSRNYAQAEVVIQVGTSTPLNQDQKLNLEVLDDVTGIYFNPTQYEMAQQDPSNYFIRLPLVIGSEIKYRFSRKSSTTDYEVNATGKTVRFRSLKVTGPMIIQEMISGWSDQPYTGKLGRIRGQLIDQANNAPIPNMMICAGGSQTISASDGSFVLENLPLGTYHLSIFSMDGSYEYFQQGATIAEEATTPVFVTLKKRPVVNVQFTVKIPKSINTEMPLRFASNISSMGNLYADHLAGSAIIASTIPVIEKIASDTYKISLSLPSGTDLRYKYTFGDGFWNSELDSAGNFVLRQLIVPSSDSKIQEEVGSLISTDRKPIEISVTTPLSSPANEYVSLQLNPFTWMEPIPMVKKGDNLWSYTLFTPLHLVGNIDYRFCRNDLCDYSVGETATQATIVQSTSEQSIAQHVIRWTNLSVNSAPTSVVTDAGGLNPRPGYISGIELNPIYTPYWSTSISQGLASGSSLGSNWVILSPTWSITSVNPPLFEPLPGSDLLWPDLQKEITTASISNMDTIIFPRINTSSDFEGFWQNSIRDTGWWQSFFDRYHRFILQNADIAAMMNVKGFIVGDPLLTPAMSGGLAPDGNPSNVPSNADDQWKQLIQDIRARYNGPIIGVAVISENETKIPEWLAFVDAVYVLYSPSLSADTSASVNDFIGIISGKLDQDVYPVYQLLQKPLIIGVEIPSNNQALQACSGTNPQCENYSLSEGVNLEIQTKLYNALIINTASKTWVSGFISRGYYPYLTLQDNGNSIYGKPASDVLWFWYHYLLNKAP